MTTETDTPSTPSDNLNNTGSQTSPEASASDGSSDSTASSKKSAKKTTRKKTAKKPAAKKTTKKAAAKKTAKKTTKKAAAKKTAKKTTKKTTAKADETPDTDAPDTEPVEAAEPEAATDETPESKPAAKKTAKRSSKRAPRRAPAGSALESGDLAASEQAEAEMIVNYVPGEECRIAIVENGQLEEFYSEPTGSVSRVGNIYVGRVTNVESSIQAAFVDFGLPENGFLHSSDIHPRYFPSGSDTEQVGKKTPRRERPPIQQCLKKGQEIIVQVLKEGVGTKGPSLTSYLSVPGRYLVMMPDMDSLGVSRKEDDEDKRREAKRILSQLDIPEGFGFILRTAGFGRTKAELKRDLAYLQRLWADMEKKRKKGNKPRLLYSESDLLLRSMRDLVGAHITRVVIDDPGALERAARFLKIVSPRSQAKLASYTGARPVFYAFGVEDQIKMIHSREVPLPSGGRLIIDQTEALVAIDVNSGKSRGAKDAETNAYKTNLEAVDVICRQLRLRDLGGLVISDLIDMRHLRHRQAIEQRFLERLKNDRAKSTILPISQFGILEMTRQRMRGSQESLNFAECQTCKGRGLVQRPDSVTAEALRHLADILQHDKVDRAELVVHPKIAGSLLTTRRASLTRVELRSGKKVDVRVSETHALDRVTVYAYDASGNDIDTDRLKTAKRAPEVTSYDPGEIPEDADDGFAADLKAEAAAQSTTALAEQLLQAARADTDDSILEIAEGDLPPEGDGHEGSAGEGGKKKRRRRRRGGRGRRKEGEEGENSESRDHDDHKDEHAADKSSSDRPSSKEPEASATGTTSESDDSEPTYSNPKAEDDSDHAEGEGGGKKKRRRRRRGGRGRRKDGEGHEGGDGEHRAEHDGDEAGTHEANNASVLESVEPETAGTGPKKPQPIAADDGHDEDHDEGHRDAPKKKRSRRGGRKKTASKGDNAPAGDNGKAPKADAKPADKPSSSTEPKAATAPAKKKRRTLYSATRRKLSGAEAERPKE